MAEPVFQTNVKGSNESERLPPEGIQPELKGFSDSERLPPEGIQPERRKPNA